MDEKEKTELLEKFKKKAELLEAFKSLPEEKKQFVAGYAAGLADRVMFQGEIKAETEMEPA